MRIFFITSKLNFRTAGGSVEEIDFMIRTLQRFGNDVVAVTVFSHANDIPHPLPYRVFPEYLTATRLLPIQWGVYKILKKYAGGADLFHVDGHLMLYGAGLYRWLGGTVPIAAFFNRELGSWPPDTSDLLYLPNERLLHACKRKLRCAVEKYLGMPLANGMDLFSFITPLYQTAYENFGLRKDSESFVIADPIDFETIMRENNISEDSYRQRNKRQYPITLFFSSRMAPGKGFDFLLTAFSKVQHTERFRLILGGTGPEEKSIKRLALTLGLEPYVYFPGWVSKEQLYTFYTEADIFLQARWRRIGASISLLYAMAFGLPSIVPAGTGLAWQANGGALHFNYDDAAGLARAIEKLGSDRALRERLSRNCYTRLREDDINGKKQIRRLYEKMKRITARP